MQAIKQIKVVTLLIRIYYINWLNYVNFRIMNVWVLFDRLERRMSTPARKRLMRDFKRLQQDPPAGISGAPQDNNIMLWNAVIFGYCNKYH